MAWTTSDGMTWATTKSGMPGDWRRRRAATLAEHDGRCHLCGHAGAEQVDHVVPRSQGGTDDVGNLAPAHAQPCPTCGRRCHQAKTQTEAAAGRTPRRRRAERHPGLVR
ncbi:MAG: HNH endonuclease [Acidimicrobiales bacterium]